MAEKRNVPISKRLVLINSASGIVTRLLTVGVFAWVIQYLMKRISEEELQLLPIVMSIAMILPFLQAMLTAGLSRHITEAYARQDLERVTAIVSSQFPLLLVTAILLMCLTAVIAAVIDRILNIPPEYVGQMRLMLMLVGARLSIGMALVPFNTGLFARQRFVVQNVIEVIGSVIRIGLMVGLILGLGPKVQWVIVSMVASQLFVVLATTAVSMLTIPALRYRPSSFNWQICRENLSFGWWYTLIQLAGFIRKAADFPILNLLATPVAVNDFFLGSTVDTQLREVTIRAGIPLLPALTAMHAHGQHERLASAFLRGARIALWISMLCATPLMVFSYDLFYLYLGPKYEAHVDAATVMILLLLGIPLTNTSSMFGQIANARGDLRPLAIRGVVSQLGNLALTLVFVGPLQMGAVGSALASLIAYAIVNPFYIWPLALRTLQISWSRLIKQSLLPGLAPSVSAACVALLTIPLIGPSSIARVLIGGFICVLVYAIVVLLCLKPADRADLARVRQVIHI